MQPGAAGKSFPGTFALVPAGLVAQNTLLPEGMPRYEPTGYPDRIVLTFGGAPSSTQGVTWRTGEGVDRAVAEIAVAGDSPGLHLESRTVEGSTTSLDTENGRAHHHSIHFAGLRPNPLYAYRVRGQDTWSEWLQFRTRKKPSSPSPFSTSGTPRTR